MADKKKPFFSEKDRDIIFNQAINFWDNSTEKMAPFFSRANDYDRMYHVKLPLELQNAFDSQEDRSAMVPPDIHNNVRSTRSQISELLFSRKPYATVSHEGQPHRRDDKVDKAEAILSADIDTSKFKKAADKINHQSLVAGLSCCITEWHIKYRRVPMRDEDTGRPKVSKKNGQIEFGLQRVNAYPRCVPIDIRRTRIDDKAENFEDVRIIGYNAKWNESDLINLGKAPDSYISFKDDDLKDSVFPSDKYYEHVMQEKPLQNKEDKASYGDRPVEIIEIRGIFQLNDKYRDLIVKIANRSLLIEARPNDLPVHGWETFDFAVVDVEFNKMFTMGVIEPAEDVFIEEFIKRNQSLDASNRQTYDMYLADMMATADLPDKISFVGGKILNVNLAAASATDVRSVFQPIPRTANPIDTFQQSEYCRNDVKQVMRQNEYRQGVDPTRKETATAVNSLEGAGIRDMKQLIGYLGMSYMFPVWEKYLIYRDFFQGHEQTQITKEDGTNITVEPGDLGFAFSVTVDVSAALDRPFMVRRIVETLPMFVGNPLLDQYNLFKNVLWYLQYPNQEKILPPPEKKIADIERENLALREGIQVPVHPADDHSLHVEVLDKRATADAQDPNFKLTPEAIAAYNYHREEHLGYMNQGNNPGGINTPKAKDGANTGQVIAGNNARITSGIQGTTPG
ncbi:MAG: hypothetical protein KAR42_17595 [candidate division Zixibacteria bacterium]|nr:hypothetical protein [candidate division Zixibacteria bacterium]